MDAISRPPKVKHILDDYKVFEILLYFEILLINVTTNKTLTGGKNVYFMVPVRQRRYICLAITYFT